MTFTTVIYVLVNNYFIKLDISEKQDVWYVMMVCILSITIFITMWLVLVFLANKNHIKKQELNKKNNINNLKTTLDACCICAETKLQDGFHYHGLLTLDELEQYEESLAEDPHPEKCQVLVYTSDLATEKHAEIQVEKNRLSGVQYIILFFQNSCSEKEIQNIKSLYNESNLINLSKEDRFRDSFDGKLSESIGFDIMIFKNSKGEKRGFFAVDFVPENVCRKKHTPNCDDKCNYGIREAKNPKEKKDPFYKEISAERVSELYREINKIYKVKRDEI